MFSAVWTSRIPAVVAAAKGRAEQAVAKTAHDIENDAKTRAPVRTGNLRGSVQATGGGMAWRVNVGAYYGIYVEFGTHKMSARPYLIPAAEAARGPFMAAMAQITG